MAIPLEFYILNHPSKTAFGTDVFCLTERHLSGRTYLNQANSKYSEVQSLNTLMVKEFDETEMFQAVRQLSIKCSMHLMFSF